MSLDVAYQGLTIAKDARVRFEDGALFVEVEGPMPVATQLLLSHKDKTLLGRVRRVREGSGAGMLIAPVESAKLPRWLMALHPETAQAAQFEAEVEAPPPPVAPPPETPPAAANAANAASPASPEAAEAAPSNRTPDSEGEGANGDEEDSKAASAKPGDKKATPSASKAKKKPRRR